MVGQIQIKTSDNLNKKLNSGILTIRENHNAFQRGSNWDNTTDAGVFALNLNNAPTNSTNNNIGFRCASDQNKRQDGVVYV